MFKCAIVGVSGSRARGHAAAYAHIPRGQLVAVSSRQRDKLDAFADEFGVAQRFTDYREMFEKARPDLVHVNTPPDVRLEIMQAADNAGIPALIIEKPLAVQAEDYEQIRLFAENARTKIAINHQLHFQPRRARLQQIVRDGGIGEVRFLDASARMNLAYQGTHALQAIAAFYPQGRPVAIMGQVAGASGLQPNAKKHYAPDECLAGITFHDDVSAMLRCGRNAPHVLRGDARTHLHKRIAVFGTRGYVQWTMWSWEVGRDGHIERGEHQYSEEDILGQAGMTEAMFDWLLDVQAVHPLNLEAALQDFHIVLAVYTSALQHNVMTLDDPLPPRLIEALVARL